MVVKSLGSLIDKEVQRRLNIQVKHLLSLLSYLSSTKMSDGEKPQEQSQEDRFKEALKVHEGCVLLDAAADIKTYPAFSILIIV